MKSQADRALWLGGALSLLWHFFWFFSVTITVGPDPARRREPMRSVSLGPVLDDTIFQTLVENRPKVSEAFYRQLSDFEPPAARLEPEAPAIQRREPGDVVSVPFGKKYTERLKEFMDGARPEASVGAFGTLDSVEGPVARREVLSRPARPDFSEKSRSVFGISETLVEFVVGPTGEVSEARVLVSSGDPAMDQAWIRYVLAWRFAPGPFEKGRVRLRPQ